MGRGRKRTGNKKKKKKKKKKKPRREIATHTPAQGGAPRKNVCRLKAVGGGKELGVEVDRLCRHVNVDISKRRLKCRSQLNSIASPKHETGKGKGGG